MRIAIRFVYLLSWAWLAAQAGAPYSVLAGETDSGGFPKTPARLCIASANTESCYIPPKQDPPFGLNPQARDVKVRGGERVIFFTAESSAGGSGSLTILALLQEHNGQLIDLLPNIKVTNQSEYRMWDLPGISAMPILATADYVWNQGESHFSHHHYRITAYVYDKQTGHYLRRDHFVTSRKYRGLDDADAIRVLELEKAEILARLQLH